MSPSTSEDNQSQKPDPQSLPPVEPPTMRFVVQLVVLPFVVVAVVVLVYVLFGQLATGQRDAMDYVQEIRSGNPHRRWRAAFELASLIHNDRQLSTNPKLLGMLAQQLDQALDDPETDPRLRQYLARTLGAFRRPDGRTQDRTPINALTVLAEAIQPNQPNEVRKAAAQSLARLAGQDPGPIPPEVVKALAGVLDDPTADSLLRQLAVYALGFINSPKATEALRAAIGPGETDRYVRYNAAAALGRQGDPKALPLLREMLRPQDLRQVIDLESASETNQMITSLHLEALKALERAIEAGHPEPARRLRPEVQDLTDARQPPVRTKANALLQKLQDHANDDQQP